MEVSLQKTGELSRELVVPLSAGKLPSTVGKPKSRVSVPVRFLPMC